MADYLSVDYLKGEAAWHWETARRALRLTPVWVLFVPALCVVALIFLHRTPVAQYLTKDWDELVSPPVLFAGFLISLWSVWRKPHTYYNWLALLAFATFLRELHFYGTNLGYYIAFVVLMLWASKNRERLEPYISNRRIVTLLMTVIWVYLVSKTFDKHWWDFLIAGTDGRDLFEENLELVGHILFVVLTAVSATVAVTA